MPAYTARATVAWEVLHGSPFVAAGQPVVYQVGTAKVMGADRYLAATGVLSAGLSAQQLSLAPLGVSAPASLMMLSLDQPVDIRTNSPADAVFLSGVTLWLMAGYVSAVYVTTGASDTTYHVEACGGSNAVLQASLPLP